MFKGSDAEAFAVSILGASAREKLEPTVPDLDIEGLARDVGDREVLIVCPGPGAELLRDRRTWDRRGFFVIAVSRAVEIVRDADLLVLPTDKWRPSKAQAQEVGMVIGERTVIARITDGSSRFAAAPREVAGVSWEGYGLMLAIGVAKAVDAAGLVIAGAPCVKASRDGYYYDGSRSEGARAKSRRIRVASDVATRVWSTIHLRTVATKAAHALEGSSVRLLVPGGQHSILDKMLPNRRIGVLPGPKKRSGEDQ